MTKLAVALQRDIIEISNLIEERRYEQTLFLIIATSGSAIEEFHRVFSVQDFISKNVDPDNLGEIVKQVHDDNGRKMLYINAIVSPQKVDDFVEPLIPACYSVMTERPDISFVLFIDEFSRKRIPGWLEKNNIPNHFFKHYVLGQVDEDDFLLWFKAQFPVHLRDDVLKLLIHGTGTNFSNAISVRDAFYDHSDPKQFFLTDDNMTEHTAQFFKEKREYHLRSENGAELRIPSGFFLFDTSAIISASLPAFISRIKSGEWINPKIIMDELHIFEEKYKRDVEMRMSVTQMKNNLKLINDILVRRSNAELRKKKITVNPDLKIITIARETGAIIVTADEMMFLNCKNSRVPVVRFLP